MKVQLCVLLFAVTYWRVCESTCVLESDFGLVINCAFKKSSLFRVRNLGGVKAHFSWGLTIGDELGFKESLSNTDMNRRRSSQGSQLQAQLVEAQQEAQKKKALVVPPPLVSPESSKITSKGGTNVNSIEVTTPITLPTLRSIFTSSLLTASEPTNATSGSTPSPSTSSLELVPSINETISNHLTTNLNVNEISSVKPATNRPPRSKLPIRKKSTINKVLAAPNEYHPIGYSKASDDDFIARVKLPKSSFQCRDQKYFPGLYADEDLGCMVFHVCVLVDTGVVTKSFLCPESTLFDQRILKCNWWFYVDCKQSKQRYETNIPVMRSYQLMRALAAIVANRRAIESANNAKEKQ